MIKALLYVEENLASSIALRYAANTLPKLSNVEVHLAHVEEPADRQQAGTGWVRRTLEKSLHETGREVVMRLLTAEKLSTSFEGALKVFVGDREREILEELRVGVYDLYIEGNVSTFNPRVFYHIITSRLYASAPCPVMMVKNLAVNNTVALLLGDGVNHEVLAERFVGLTADRETEVELVFYKFQEQAELSFLDRGEGGNALPAVEKILHEAGKEVRQCHVISGTPEKAGIFLEDFALVASTFPTRKDPRMEVLANTTASLFLCR